MGEKTLEKYLEDIEHRGSSEGFSQGGRYDPSSFAFDRTGYEIYYSENGPFAVKGGAIVDSRAQEVEREHIREIYKHLQENPENIGKLIRLAEKFHHNNYDELSEEIIGKVIKIQPGNLEAYHLLARMHLDNAANLENNGYIKEAKKHSHLAELISEQGLSIVDSHATSLIEDVLMALRMSGKMKKHDIYSKKLSMSYREKFRPWKKPI